LTRKNGNGYTSTEKFRENYELAERREIWMIRVRRTIKGE